MPQVKIVLTKEAYINEDYANVIVSSISDWEEISDEDLKLLQDRFYSLNLGRQLGLNPALIVKDTVPVLKRIESIKEIIQKEREAMEVESLKRKLAAEEREKKKKMRKKEDELKLLEELKKKYEKDKK